MNHNHYAMNEADSKALLAKFEAARKPLNEAYRKLAEDYGADDVIVRHCNFSGIHISGLMFKEDPGERRGMKAETTRLEDGSRVWIVTPNRRFKEGKKLDADIHRASSVKGAGNFSPWAVDQTGMHHEVFSRRAMHFTTMSFAKGLVVACVPVGEKGELPEIDPRFTSIKKSKFIELTEE